MPTLAQRDTSGTFALRKGERHEVESRRSRSGKTFRCVETEEDKRAGLHRYRVGCQVGPVHYPHDVFSERPRWHEIDCEIRRAAEGDADYAMTECGYQFRAWQSRATGKSAQARALNYIGEFSRGGAAYRMAPLSLSWLAADGAEELIARPIAGIEPVLPEDDYAITWPGAFGPGIDYGYNTRPDHMFKALTVRDRKALPEPKRVRPTHLLLRLWVSWDGDGSPDVDLPSVAAEYQGKADVAAKRPMQGRYAHKRQDGRECFWIQEPEAWDSAEEGQQRWRLDWWYETRGAEVVLCLALPVAALESAVYPLVMDTDMAEEQVGASADDARTYGGSTTYVNEGTMYINGLASEYCGMRFRSVPLDNGVDIDTAYISLKTITNDDPRCTIYCEDVDDSTEFTTSSPNRPIDRTLTTASVSWSQDNLGTNTWVTSVSLASCVQEVVDRGGWASGNALTVHTVASVSTPYLRVYTYDQYLNVSGPKLNVSYTVASPPASVTLSDATTTTDTMSAKASYKVSMASAVGIDDAVTALHGHLVALQDSLTVDDAAAVAAGYVVGLTDALTASDGLSILQGHLAALSDNVGLIDTIAAAGAYRATLVDALSATDAIDIGGALSVVLSDTLSMTDAIAAQAAFAVALSDGLNVADAISLLAAYAVTCNDALTVGDALTARLNAVVSMADAVTASDELSAVYRAAVSLAETMGIGDDVSVMAAYLATLADGLTVADALSVLAAYKASLSDSVTAADDLQARYAAIVGLADVVTAEDALTARLGVLVSIADSLSAVDSITARFGVVLALVDALGLNDSITTEAAYRAVMSDSVTAGDSLSVIAAYLVALSDGLTLSDAISAVIAAQIITLPRRTLVLDARPRGMVIDARPRTTVLDARSRQLVLDATRRRLVLDARARQQVVT